MSALSLTVIIPVFNRPQLLERALLSLVAQTRRDFRVVVSDDGSTPPMESVCDRFRGSLDLSYVYSDHFGRPSRARNLALRMAGTDWVGFLDSDDAWDPERVRRIAPYLNDSRDVVYHRLRLRQPLPIMQRLQSRCFRSGVGSPISSRDPRSDFAAKGNAVAMSSATVRTPLLRDINGFDESLVCNDDYDAWVRLAARHARFFFIPEVLGTYDRGQGRISSSLGRAQAARAVFRKSHAAFFTRSDFDRIILRYDYLDLLASQIDPRLAPGPGVCAIPFRRSPAYWLGLRVRRHLSRWLRV